MVDAYVLIQTGAAVVTALAAAGAFAYVRSGLRSLREHDRVLFGEDSVDGWNGIVPVVQRNRECIEELKTNLPPDD